MNIMEEEMDKKENISSNNYNAGDQNGRKCLELALEGERLCKNGDFKGGIAFFEAAVKEGTQDMRTLSAIYSQLGNAYFYINKYDQALRYHKLDLAIARTMRDRTGEGKASGNLGNTYKMLGRFDEAVECCKSHLNISIELKDQTGKGRALYNLGNVYHTKGKQMARSCDPGELPADVKECLSEAVKYYEKNLALLTELGDRSGQGRACGNLGNSHYLLGNFNQAIVYHQERLKIAKEFGDVAAERRAHCNLGNSNVFLGNFELAINNYEDSLRLARELQDKVAECQACLSLGNCHTLLHNHDKALEYHLAHLKLVQEDINDRKAEVQCCWNICHSLIALKRYQEALEFAERHRKVSVEVQKSDPSSSEGISEAEQLITSINRAINEEQGHGQGQQESRTNLDDVQTPPASRVNTKKHHRLSMEKIELMKLTPGQNPGQDEDASSPTNFQSSDFLPLPTATTTSESKSSNQGPQTQVPVSQRAASKPPRRRASEGVTKHRHGAGGAVGPEPDLLDMIVSFQRNRLEDQRCPAPGSSLPPTQQTRSYNSVTSSEGCIKKSVEGSKELDFLDKIASFQSCRLDDQRCQVLQRATPTPLSSSSSKGSKSSFSQRSQSDFGVCEPDSFLDMIATFQKDRMEDQRCQITSLPPLSVGTSSSTSCDVPTSKGHNSAVHQIGRFASRAVRRSVKKEPKRGPDPSHR